MISLKSYLDVQAGEQCTVLDRPEMLGQYGRLAGPLTPERSTMTVTISSSSADWSSVIQVVFP